MSDTNALSMVPSTRHAGQATMVEQARAVAEVRGAIMVAQDCPRDLIRARHQMLESCAIPTLAEKAFWRFPRGNKYNEETKKWEPNMLTGSSIFLMRELARCWGNVQYGIDEMRRDDAGGVSEMRAWAWDVQTNTRSSNTFIVPHTRDTKKGTEKLTDTRDVYENNTNQASRRLRTCIVAILPPWFVFDAEEACRETNKSGGGVPLVRRIEGVLSAFAHLRQPVTRKQLEMKLGRLVSEWDGEDVALLTTVGRSLKAGETTRDEEFPPERVESTAGLVPGEKPAVTPPPVVEVVGSDDDTDDTPAATDSTEWSAEDTAWPDVTPPGTGQKVTQ